MLNIRKFLRSSDFQLLAVCAFLIAGMATLWGYNYGTGNQVEQLPIVLRALDHSYLSQDFFVNASEAYGPRLYYAAFLASLTSWSGLPLYVVFLVLTMLANFMVALVSGLVARDLFDKSLNAGLLAVCAVMGLKTFWLGGSNTISSTFLEPSHLVMPLLLATLWAGLRQRPLAVVLAASLSALIHPLVGLEVGSLALGVVITCTLLTRLWPRLSVCQPAPVGRLAVSALILAGAALFLLAPYFSLERIDVEWFIYIVAYLRHPHHYLPSTFGLLQYAQAVAFIISAGIAGYLGARHSSSLRNLMPALGVLVAALVVLSLGGYVFVELIPQRIWVTAQVYRLLFIIKWLGLILMSGWAARRVSSFDGDQFSFSGWMLVGALMAAPAMIAAFCYEWLRHRISLKLWARPVAILTGLAVVAGLAINGLDLRVYLLFPIFVLMAMFFSRWRFSWRFFSAYGLALAVVLLVLYQRVIVLPPAIAYQVATPIVTLDDLTGEQVDVATFARQHTPPDAVFLASPKFGEFRLLAERAIVVDFKSFPFQDAAMLEWYQRLLDCCGDAGYQGWTAEKMMTIEYNRLDDEKLLHLQDIYGFNYAVLFNDLPTGFPVLFEGQKFKIISMADPAAEGD